MKKQLYLIPLFAVSLMTLAACDEQSGDSSVPPAPAVETSAETPAADANTETAVAPATEEAPAEDAAATEAAPVETHITVTDATAYATAASARNGAIFATISNSAAKGDLLLSAKTTVASRVEVHQSYEDPQTGAMLMRRTSGVDVQANGSTKLEPTGFHIMLMDLGQPLVAGETFDVELRFRDAGIVPVSVTVVAPGGDAASADPLVQHESADHDDHNGHDHGAEETPAPAPASASDATAEAVEEAPAADATAQQ